MATERQKQAFDKIVDNHGNVSKTMLEVGYSENSAKNPKNLTDSDGWKELMSKHLPDELLAQKHRDLLDSTVVQHMVFPLGPKGEDDINLSGAKPNALSNTEEKVERTSLTDQEIKDLLAGVNCTVKRIVHGENARHVYFWAQDSQSVVKALDMAYKLKGKNAPERSVNTTVEISLTGDQLDLAQKFIDEQKRRTISDGDSGSDA